MPAPIAPLRVFISSTWTNLQAERAAIRELVHRLRGLHFVGMEHFGANEDTPERTSLAAVDQTDLYVGVIGSRYGSGITELEYRRAGERGLKRLIYLERDDASRPADGDIADAERRAAFVAMLRRAHTCVWFDSPRDLAYKLSLDLHNYLLESHLAGGLGPLSSDYLSRVQAFVAEYTGSATRPVPFGGRTAELAALDAWLADDRAPGCLLVAAAAGRGKSALLVRWSRQLLAGGAAVPLFFPVSIRFGTSTAGVVFKSMLSYLAALHGLPSAAGAAAANVESLRGQLADLLRRPLSGGRRLVVVLDGLDEAADWQAGPDLLPPWPEPQVRLVVSARLLAGDTDAKGWLGRLGWDSPGAARAIELPGLAVADVADALSGMEAPLSGLATRDEFVYEMHRLSDGDPLLVRLYVDHLREQARQGRALTLAELRDLPPGLDGYFSRWWRDQERLWGSDRPLERQQVQALMDLLANAFGPLSHEDLLALAPPEAPWSSWSLRQAVAPLQRFVVGDGQQAGYVFSHPRLSLHLRERLTRGERRAIDERFVSWCARVLAQSEEEPNFSLSAYVVQFHGAHLDRIAAGPQAYAPLLGDASWRGWLALEGTIAGYRSDLVRVEQALARDGDKLADHGALAARCALCMASVDEVARSTPSRIVVSLVRQGLWGRAAALQYARAIDDAATRAAALTDLAADEAPGQRERIAAEVLQSFDDWYDGEAMSLDTLGRLEPLLAVTSLDQALTMALRPNSLSARSRALGVLFRRVASGSFDLIVAHILRLRDASDRQQLLRELAAQRPKVALALADRPDLDRWDVFWMLTAALPGLDGVDRRNASEHALAILEHLKLATLLPIEAALRSAALELAANGEPTHRPALLRALRSSAASVRSMPDRLKLLFCVAAMSPPDEREAVSAIAFEALASTRPDVRVDTIRACAARLAPDEAVRALESIVSDHYVPGWGLTLTVLLPRLTRAQRQRATALLLSQVDPTERFEAGVEACRYLAPDQLADLAWDICADESVPSDRCYEWLARLAPHLDAKVVKRGMEIAVEVRPTDERTLAALAALAQWLPDAVPDPTPHHLLALLRDDGRPLGRSTSYVEYWAAAARPVAVRRAAQALAGAIEGSGGGTQLQRRALLALAPRLERDLLQQAVRALQVIGDVDARRQTLEACFELMPAAVVLARHAESWRRLGDDARGRLSVAWWVRGDRPAELTLTNVLEQVHRMPSEGAYFDQLKLLLAFEGQAPADLVERTARDAKAETGLYGRATRTLTAMADHLPPGALERHLGTLLHAMLGFNPERAPAVAASVPVAHFDTAFTAHLAGLAQEPGGYVVLHDLQSWITAYRFAWQLGGDHRRMARDRLSSVSRRLPQASRARLVAALLPEAPVGSDEQASLQHLAETVTEEPWRTLAAIALLTVTGVAGLPRHLAHLLTHLKALEEPRRQEIAGSMPDGLLRDLARAGAWRSALALLAAGPAGRPVFGWELERDMLAEAWLLWQQFHSDRSIRPPRDLALALALTLMPSLGTKGLRAVTATTLAVMLSRSSFSDPATQWTYRLLPAWALPSNESGALVAEFVFSLLREWLSDTDVRRIQWACNAHAEGSPGFGTTAALVPLLRRGALPRHAQALLAAGAGNLVCAESTATTSWLEERVCKLAGPWRWPTARPAESAAGRRPTPGGMAFRLRARRNDSTLISLTDRTWKLLLMVACRQDWAVLRSGHQDLTATTWDRNTVHTDAPPRTTRAAVMAGWVERVRQSNGDRAGPAAALAEAVLEAGRRWP